MRTLTTLIFLALFVNISTAQVYVDLNAAGNNDGTSWADAYNNLQIALDSAGPAAQLWVAAGIYTPEAGSTVDSTRFVAIETMEIYGGFDGTETMLEQRDWETNLTVFSGDLNGDDVMGDFTTNRDDNARNVLVVTGGFAPFVVDGVSIRSGNGREDDIPPGTVDFFPWFGSGILAIGNTNIRNCSFSENSGFIGSAFAAAFGSFSNLELDNCSFSSNFSILCAVRLQNSLNGMVRNCNFSNNKAEVFGAGVVVGNGNYTFEDCDFESNSVSDGIGAGLFVFQNSFSSFSSPHVDVRRCNFTENIAEVGAALAFNNFFEGSSILVDSCNFSSNTVPDGGGYGSAICMQNYPDNVNNGFPSLAVDVRNSVITDNEADFAPALYMASFAEPSILDVSNCLIELNSAIDDFGAVGVFNNSSFIDVEFEGVVFEDNYTDGVGGAIGFFNNNDDGPMEYSLDSCVFDGNGAREAGGAIWSSNANGTTFGATGEINNTVFLENVTEGCCGAILSSAETLLITQSEFSGNSTEATDTDVNGGGAITFINGRNATIQHSLFEENESATHGAAILHLGTTDDHGTLAIENSVLTLNDGESTILNTDTLQLTNVTMIDNEKGVLQANGGHMQSQNTIHSTQMGNYENPDSTATVVSLGGNLSSDGSLSEYFIGFGAYDDFNNASSELTSAFVPLETSPCVDAGNPDGITATEDYAGEMRIQGATIDIGALESAFNTPVRELNALKINVYPNPFASTLELSNTEDVEQIRLLNAAGKYVQSFPIEQTLHVNSELAAGTYFLEVLINGKTYFKKLSKG